MQGLVCCHLADDRAELDAPSLPFPLTLVPFQPQKG
jgi:hypothetical protein